jgi:hypothetical protein
MAGAIGEDNGLSHHLLHLFANIQRRLASSSSRLPFFVFFFSFFLNFSFILSRNPLKPTTPLSNCLVTFSKEEEEEGNGAKARSDFSFLNHTIAIISIHPSIHPVETMASSVPSSGWIKSPVIHKPRLGFCTSLRHDHLELEKTKEKCPEIQAATPLMA